ncbi:hypothetical protein Sp245p_11280 [Azospirillum baldaniorum]|uniref:YCII-related domain-containing protein n=1 Tax=Azospirillum baldaniorum TaxID=1064539 RepID=A0A9P1JPY9_9PROT|nr:YciI family protein [Azospirillum baldaniorum]AWJ90327.1 hypothetical protein Sp245p_11280 [Azospirillum baldaniorum]NUB04880.1 YciI family protein [Azospirillum baldaniorum]TWA75192.1 hypothetical protein FBZ85_11216 [Azospirillum brasilense]CCC97557.1 conserved protein of unknown function [Azospirillum baldaniorum]
MIWAIWCKDSGRAAAIRSQFGKDHSAYLTASPLPILMAGPLTGDDGEGSAGSLILVEADSRGAVEAFVSGDPFAVHGVWESFEVQAFRMSRKNL